MPLTDMQIRRAMPGHGTRKYSDGGGLHLEVRASGTKLWRYRYRIAGRENVFAIGAYFEDRRQGHVSLEDARSARDRARALVRQGIHPAHVRRAERLAAAASNVVAVETVAQDLLELVRRIERRGAQAVASMARQRVLAGLREAAYRQKLLEGQLAGVARRLAQPRRDLALAASVRRRMESAKRKGQILALFDAVREELLARSGPPAPGLGAAPVAPAALNAAYIEVRRALAAARLQPGPAR
jgi:hypothetical protein